MGKKKDFSAKSKKDDELWKKIKPIIKNFK